MLGLPAPSRPLVGTAEVGAGGAGEWQLVTGKVAALGSWTPGRKDPEVGS